MELKTQWEELVGPLLSLTGEILVPKSSLFSEKGRRERTDREE